VALDYPWLPSRSRWRRLTQARLGARNLIEGRRNFDVQGRTFGVAAGAGTPFAFRSIICVSVVAATSVLQLVSAVALLMVRLLHLWEQVAPLVCVCRYASARGYATIESVHLE
jgi:hypothetical protein